MDIVYSNLKGYLKFRFSYYMNVLENKLNLRVSSL